MKLAEALGFPCLAYFWMAEHMSRPQASGIRMRAMEKEPNGDFIDFLRNSYFILAPIPGGPSLGWLSHIVVLLLCSLALFRGRFDFRKASGTHVLVSGPPS